MDRCGLIRPQGQNAAGNRTRDLFRLVAQCLEQLRYGVPPAAVLGGLCNYLFT